MNLRSTPNHLRDDNVIARIRDALGDPVEVLETSPTGWYLIQFEPLSGRYSGLEGWVFGAFVSGEHEGFVAGESPFGPGGRLFLSTDSGDLIPNPTGGHVLLTEVDAGWSWPVLTPDGNRMLIEAESIIPMWD